MVPNSLDQNHVRHFVFVDLGPNSLQMLSAQIKIKRTDWQLEDTCPQAANHCALF